jgi:hypothetical protein
LRCRYKGLVFCRNNSGLMENMDNGLIIPKWVLINRPKIPQMPHYLSDQFVRPSPQVLDFNEKSLHWASVVCGNRYQYLKTRSQKPMFWIVDYGSNWIWSQCQFIDVSLSSTKFYQLQESLIFWCDNIVTIQNPEV